MEHEREDFTDVADGRGLDASDPYAIAPRETAGDESSGRPALSKDSSGDAVVKARRGLKKKWRDDEQFTLSGLLVLITIFSLVFAPLAWMPLEIFAGVIGAAALILMCVISVWPGRRIIVDVAWWCLLGTYVMVCGMLCVRAW